MFSEYANRLLISVPDEVITAQYCETLLTEMRKLFNICEKNASHYEERWGITPASYYRGNVNATERLYTYTNLTAAKWYDELTQLRQDCAAVGIEAYVFSERQKKSLVWLFGEVENVRMNSSAHSPREIRMEIPRTIWRMMDIQAFIEAVQHACCTLNATYASIDTEAVNAPSLDQARFFEYSSNLRKTDWESYIPDIYWGQFIPAQRIKNAADFNTWVDTVPCEKKKLLTANGKGAAWLQLDCDIWKPTAESRLALRKHFQDSLPVLSIEKMANVPYLMDYRIDLMPLLPNERAELERLRKKRTYRKL